jgi:hypothetical protein
MLAPNEEQFNQKLNEFYIIEKNTKKIKYFEDNWLNCVDMWAKYKRRGLAINLQETNNQTEIINPIIKSYLGPKHANKTLAQCLRSILDSLESLEKNKQYLSYRESNQVLIVQSAEPIVNEFYKIASENMAHWLKAQYEKSQSTIYQINHESIDNTNYVLLLHDEKKYLVKNYQSDQVSCDCYENLSLNLPCRHIFFVRKWANLSLFNINMVPERHRINRSINNVLKSNVNLIAKIPAFDDHLALITSTKMTSVAKYNTFMRLAQETCQKVCKLKQSDYVKALKSYMCVNKRYQAGQNDF